jgi:hypothetical protein
MASLTLALSSSLVAKVDQIVGGASTMGSVSEETGRLRLVVCDTGPVLHIREAGALDLLAKTGEV